MIQVENLTRFYGEFAAIQDIGFSVDDGEVVGLLGRNGAGKSTILKILAGVLMPSTGRVVIDGQDVVEAPDALRRHIGFLPEEPPLYREMTVREYLRFAGGLKGMSRAAIEDRMPAVLEATQISERADQVIGELSFGYRKRVGIAQAILHDPKLVILDEPTSGLDPAQIVEMRATIRKLKESRTVLLSSHIMREISETCDRVIVLDSGRMVAQGTEEQLVGRFAGAEGLELTVRATRAQLDPVFEALELSYQLIETRGALLDLRVRDAGERVEELVAALVAGGVGVRRVDEPENELEQIFIGLTGGAA